MTWASGATRAMTEVEMMEEPGLKRKRNKMRKKKKKKKIMNIMSGRGPLY